MTENISVRGLATAEQITQLHEALRPLASAALIGGGIARTELSGEAEGQFFTGLETMSDGSAILFVDGPGTESSDGDDEGSTLQIVSDEDGIKIFPPSDMGIDETLLHLRRDAHALADAVQTKRRTKQLAEEVAAERIDTLLDTPSFGKLRALNRPATPTWFKQKHGINLAQTEVLERCGMNACYVQRVGEHSVAWFTDAWKCGEYPMILGYVTGRQGTELSVFYQSNSRAVWRWLPGFDPAKGWFSKGEDPDAMTTPLELQQTFDYITNHTPDAEHANDRRSTILREAVIVPQVNKSSRDSTPIAATRFEEMLPLSALTNNKAPDLSQPLASVDMHDGRLYGEGVRLESFSSKDNAATFIFAHSVDGAHAWLAAVMPRRASLRRQGLVYNAFTPGVEKRRPFEYLNVAANLEPNSSEEYADTYGARKYQDDPLTVAYNEFLARRSTQERPGYDCR